MEERVNEIMMTDEYEVTDVVEAFDEVKTGGSSTGLKVAVGIGVAAGLSCLAYKFVVKPLVAKIKSKKEQSVATKSADVIDVDYSVVDDDNAKKHC